MKNIDSTEGIELGEEVTTAGIELAGGIRSPYPKGLLLGQVIDVRRDANSVVQTAYLQPRPTSTSSSTSSSSSTTRVACRRRATRRSTARSTGPGGVVPGGEQPCIEPSADAPWRPATPVCYR